MVILPCSCAPPTLAVFPTMLLCALYLYMPYCLICHCAYDGVSYPGSISHSALSSHPIPYPATCTSYPCRAYLPCPCSYILLLTTQSERCHSLSSTVSFRLQACYSLLPARPGYMACRVESLCMLVSGREVRSAAPSAANSLEKNTTQYPNISQTHPPA